ncbi:ribokinase [Halobacillus dabanensis]|uniref:Ribokinase n=1 Tax=Halobacillus dabanensis TaxID=240302 RepID=A0A1I3WBB7_HALDA|nr:ribokinase [Halobacillus dabanensis]SFK03741.1 ribokinase [Halobacillus dabanensis]
MKILNFGSLNIDRVYRVPHFVREGETLSSSGYDVFAGGKGLNQSVALAKAGADVFHAGKIGPEGLFLKKELADQDVHTTFIEETGTVTGHAIIQVTDAGENSILLFGGANKEITEEQIHRVLDHFEAGDMLVMQNELNVLETVLDRAYEKGMILAFNPSPMTDQLKKLDLKKLSYLILNELEAETLMKEKETENQLMKLRKQAPELKIVLTLGAEGVIYEDESQRITQQSFPTEVVDTTAAGDTFLGYFLSMVACGKRTEEALRMASKAASLAISREGASVSIPFLYEIRED